MKLVLLVALFMSLGLPSWARCSKGYSSLEKAEAAVASSFNKEDLSWCDDLKKRKDQYSKDALYKTCSVENEDPIKISIFKVSGGLCAASSMFVVARGMYTYEYLADVDPNKN